MKTHMISAITLLMLASCTKSNLDFDKKNTAVRIEKFQWGANAAVSFTFDDGCENQFQKAIPLFDEHKMKLTLFLTTDWISDWGRVRQAAKSGHEVGSHTCSHPNLGALSMVLAEAELIKSKQIIEDSIPGYVCKTVAYPFCAPMDSATCSRYYFAARHCQGYIEGSTPISFMNISSLGCGDLSQMNSFESLKACFESTYEKGGWSVLLFHGIDKDGGYSPIQYDELERSVKYLNAYRDRYWTDTFSSIAMYIKERDAAKISDLDISGKELSFNLDDELDDEYYNQSLTISCELPQMATDVEVTQGDSAVYSVVIKDDKNCKAMFDVKPNGNTVKVKIVR